MRALFRDSPELVEMFLRTVLKKPDLKVIQSETQADLKRITGSRGLCLDVVATDDSGKKYDIEVQRDASEMKPERARYHASAMDVENSWKGMEFEELPETYVIFITERIILKEISRSIQFKEQCMMTTVHSMMARIFSMSMENTEMILSSES